MEHIELLRDLLKKCSSFGLDLLAHSCDELIYGSWSLTVGTSKQRMRFSWDGKESYLGVGISHSENGGSYSDWEPVFPSVGGTTISQQQVFEFIFQTLCERFAT